MDKLEHLLLASHPSISFDSAKRRLTKIARQVHDQQIRVLLEGNAAPRVCLVPLEDATLLMELEHRIDSDAGQRALEVWEGNGKRTSSIESLFKRFRLKPRATDWPVVIADTADTDLNAFTEDHRRIAQAIAQLGKYPAVMTARRLGRFGEIKGARIEGYRAIFLVEHERVVLLRFGAGLAQNLLP